MLKAPPTPSPMPLTPSLMPPRWPPLALFIFFRKCKEGVAIEPLPQLVQWFVKGGVFNVMELEGPPTQNAFRIACNATGRPSKPPFHFYKKWMLIKIVRQYNDRGGSLPLKEPSNIKTWKRYLFQTICDVRSGSFTICDVCN